MTVTTVTTVERASSAATGPARRPPAWRRPGAALLAALLAAAALLPAAAGAQTLPVVTVTPQALSVIGGSGTGRVDGEDAVFVLSRTGSTAASLVVDFTMTGGSNAYANYADRPSSATIPANSMTHNVVIPTRGQEEGDNFTMTLTVNAVASRYTAGDPSSASINVGAAINDGLVTGEPRITGTLEVGRTLTADTSGLDDADGLDMGRFTYQWVRADNAMGLNDDDISGETGATYTLVEADLGKHIQVEVVAQDNNGNWNARVVSEFTAAVAASTSRGTDATGMPAVTGPVVVGQALTASPGDIADADGLTSPTYSYRWQSRARGSSATAWDDIPGAAGASYTLSAAELDHRVRVVASFRDDDGNEEERPSAESQLVEASGTPVVSVRAEAATVVGDGTNNVVFIFEWTGTIASGSSFSFDVTDPNDGVLGLNLEGVNNSVSVPSSSPYRMRLPTRTLPSSAGDRVVTLTFKDGAGYAIANPVSVTVSATVTAPAAVTPVVTVAAKADTVVGGSGSGRGDAEFVLSRTGDTAAALTVDITVSGAGAQATEIADHTDATFMAGSATVEVSIETIAISPGDPNQSVRLAIDDGAGYTVGTPAEATVTVTPLPNRPATGTPAIDGVARVGGTLTVDTSDVTDPDGSLSFNYEWDRETSSGMWEDIGPQTRQNTYTPVAADLGRRLRVVVVAVDGDGAATRLTSDPTAAVAAANIPATGRPAVMGSALVGQTLTATTGDIADADGLPTGASAYSWQWQRMPAGGSWTDISGAASSTYLLDSDDQGDRVRVRVSFTDDGGTDEERFSEQSGWVGAADEPVVSLSVGAATVVGDGTNQVEFIASWTGSLASGARTFGVAVDDPADGVDAGVHEGREPESVMVPAMGPQSFLYTTRELLPGAADRVVTFTLTDFGGYALAGHPSALTATVTVRSSVPPTVVTVAAKAASVVGTGTPAAEFTLTRTEDTAAALTVGIAVTGDGRSSPANSPTEATFTAGSATAEVSVPASTLGVGDPSTSVTLTVQDGTGYTVGAAPGDAATVTVTAPENTEPTGRPSVTGDARVGETLTAGLGDIMDPDDQPALSDLTWQWQRETSTDTWEDIDSATSRTYTLADADEGLRVRVAASFPNLAISFTETVLSEPTAAVAAAAPAGPVPVVTVAASAASVVGGGSGPAVFVLSRTGDTAAALVVDFTMGGDQGAYSNYRSRPTTATIPAGASMVEVPVATPQEEAGVRWSMTLAVDDPGDGRYTVGAAPGDAATVVVTGPAANTEATGGPSVTGTARVGETLTAGIGTITDADDQPTEGDLAWQWQRETSTDTWVDIAGAASRTYTLAAADEGRRVRVRARFEDEVSNLTETVFSAPTAAVAPVPRPADAETVERGQAAEETLARFGGAVLTQVVDTVRLRLGAARLPGARATVAGQRVGGAPAGGRGARLAWTGHRRLDEAPGAPGAGRAGPRSLDGRGALAGSSFAVTGAGMGSGTAAVWGRGAYGSFESGDGGVDVEGTVTTGQVGADWSTGALTAGVAVAHSVGEGEWSGVSARGGETETALTGVYPYVGYSPTGRVSVWAAGGVGEGTLEVRPAGGGVHETDISVTMAAAGLRGDVVDGAAGRGVSVAVRADATVVRADSDAAPGLAASESETTRLRLGVEGSRPVALPGGGSLVPSVELGVLHDGGDAPAGKGVDVGAGVAWADPAGGLSADLRGRALVAHEASGVGEWGVSGEVRYEFDRSTRRGLSLSLASGWGGAASGGVDGLFALGAGEGLEADGGALPGARLEAEAGYGLGALDGRFASVPFAGAGLADEGGSWRLGWRLEPAGPGAPDLRPSVELHGGDGDGRGVRLGLEAGF